MLIKNALIATASELYKGDIHIKDGIIKENIARWTVTQPQYQPL